MMLQIVPITTLLQIGESFIISDKFKIVKLESVTMHCYLNTEHTTIMNKLRRQYSNDKFYNVLDFASISCIYGSK